MVKKLKVMVFGTFDVLHPGHLDFLRQARRLGDYLIVSVARDRNAKKFKGHAPIFKETDRLALISSIKYVDKAVLGNEKNYLRGIISEKPDIIALGYDQAAYVDELLEDMRIGKISAKIIRLKAHEHGKYKSTIFKDLIKMRHRLSR